MATFITTIVSDSLLAALRALGVNLDQLIHMNAVNDVDSIIGHKKVATLYTIPSSVSGLPAVVCVRYADDYTCWVTHADGKIVYNDDHHEVFDAVYNRCVAVPLGSTFDKVTIRVTPREEVEGYVQSGAKWPMKCVMALCAWSVEVHELLETGASPSVICQTYEHSPDCVWVYKATYSKHGFSYNTMSLGVSDLRMAAMALTDTYE